MIRILHVARAVSDTANRKAALLAADQGLSLWLVRPREASASRVMRDHPAPRARLVRCWRRSDPHRGLYATLTFGMRQAAPDIIHAEEEPDSLAALQVALARRAAAPSARLVFHTWQNVNRPKRRAVRVVLRVTLGAADAVLCASATAVSVLRAQEFTGPAPVILPVGVDAETFRPAPAPRLSTAFTVGFVGRLAPEKGLDTLVAAAAGLAPAIQLAFAGTGPCQGRLAAQAKRLGIDDRVRFVGRLDPAGVASFLWGLDVLVLPSRSTPVWTEQFGRALAEAMACGIPVVGARSGEIPEVIADAGLLFPEGDPAALSSRLAELRASPELRAECSRRGQQRALRLFSASALATRTGAFYRELAGLPQGIAG